MDNLQPHELAEFYPMHSADLLEELTQGMRDSGYRAEFPIVLYEGKILDGRNRYSAAIKAKVEPAIVQFTGDDPMAFVMQANSNRRDLEAGQRAAIGLKIQRYWNERAKVNRGGDRRSNQFIKTDKLINSQAIAAKQAGVSTGTMGMVAKLEKDAPALFDKVAKGEMTASRATTEMRKEENKTRLNSISNQEIKKALGVFDAIVIDPPWKIEKIERDVRQNQVGLDYPTMTLDEIGDLKIPCADDCHVWLWTTHKHLPDAFDLLERWGLKYVCLFTWHKPGGFQVVGLPQYNSEFCLYARRGSPKFVDTKDFMTCFDAPRGEHSEKPSLFYDTVRRVTAGRKLDMFNRKHIGGFETYGNEASG